MSIRLMTLVWEAPLPDSEKLVLLALADWANDEGVCWPSMAQLIKKCSKGERTVQNAIAMLKTKGHIERVEVPGRGCRYIVHPIARLDTPAESAPPRNLHPRKDCALPPQNLHPTPAESAPNTSKNHHKPSIERRTRRPIPDDWMPKEFGEGSESRKVIDAWPDGELEAQLEQFKANHRGKGNTFIDPQDAWSTWVLNTRKFGIGKKENAPSQYVSASGYQYRGDDEAVMKEAQRRGDNQTYWLAQANRSRKAQSIGDVAKRVMR